MAHVTVYVTGYVTYVNGLCKIRKHVACLLFIYLFINSPTLHRVRKGLHRVTQMFVDLGFRISKL